MTGYGSAKKSFERQNISVEIRSLNSKSLDLRTRMSNAYQGYELELRKMIQNELQRGKIDVNIAMESGEFSDLKINKPLLESYIYQLIEVAAMNGIERGDILQTAARLPNITMSNEIQIDENQWAEVLQVLAEAVEKFNAFRLQEGAVLEADIRARLQSIEKLLQEVLPYEADRLEKVKQRLRAQLEQLSIKVDENRFEQELIYYLEKYDISEEKVRLQQHCTYFVAELGAKNTTAKGSKLSFISQEIGREINTLGSKANLAEIQHIVVQMKDELEKIKEQLANIL
jgi:uncharacterized protein (TIGR00255 family)